MKKSYFKFEMFYFEKDPMVPRSNNPARKRRFRAIPVIFGRNTASMFQLFPVTSREICWPESSTWVIMLN